MKLDKKEREAHTRKIVELFPALAKEYKMLQNAAGDSFFLPSAKKVLLHLKQLHETRPVVACIRTFGTDLPLLKRALEELKMELVVVKQRLDVKSFFAFLHDQSFETTFRVYFVQDDYQEWKRGNCQAESGKLFPLTKGFNIFFDDNETIINPRNEKGEFVSSQHAILVDTCAAVLDKDYFVKFFP